MDTVAAAIANDTTTSVKVAVVPPYYSLKRRHGQLLKDFGLLEHQRKAVYNLVSTFMHANSCHNFRKENAPSDNRTHNSNLRKSHSLESITTQQSDVACLLPLTNTDSESDDDTHNTHHTTTLTTHPTTEYTVEKHHTILKEIASLEKKLAEEEEEEKALDEAYKQHIDTHPLDKLFEKYIDDAFTRHTAIKHCHTDWLPSGVYKRFLEDQQRLFPEIRACAERIKFLKRQLGYARKKLRKKPETSLIDLEPVEDGVSSEVEKSNTTEPQHTCVLIEPPTIEERKPLILLESEARKMCYDIFSEHAFKGKFAHTIAKEIKNSTNYDDFTSILSPDVKTKFLFLTRILLTRFESFDNSVEYGKDYIYSQYSRIKEKDKGKSENI